jgi:hypothetical protein
MRKRLRETALRIRFRRAGQANQIMNDNPKAARNGPRGGQAAPYLLPLSKSSSAEAEWSALQLRSERNICSKPGRLESQAPSERHRLGR